MADLKYKEEHNKVGYLLKPTGSDDYHQIIDFLSASHIRYALTTNPIIFDSLVKQFWSTATPRAPELGPPAILATIDKTPYTITEELVLSRLQLADDGGVADLPILEIYSGMDNLGYGMVSNIGNAKKFLMYPRFLQTILGGGAEVAEQAIPHPMPSPDHSPAHLPTPSRPQTSDPVAPVLEHDHRSDQHETAAGSFPSRTMYLWEAISIPLLYVAADLDILYGNTSQFPVASLCAPPAGHTGTSEVPLTPSAIPPGASIAPTAALAVPGDSPKVHAVVPADSPNVPAGVSSKGKSPMVEEDIPVKARTFRQIEEDKLGEDAAKRLHEEEMAEMEKERADVEVNASLSKNLLGDDVTEDNFPARTAALIKKKRQALAEQLFKERQNRLMTPAQQKAYMQQYIRKVQSKSQIQAFSRTLKRPGPVLEEPFTKRPKSPEAPTPSMPEVPVSLDVTSPPSSRTRRKSLGRKLMHKPKSTLPT
nr:JmjC domain-containing protein [Tanacetum cinerariifolium]